MKKERLRIENLRKGSLLKRIHFQICEGEIVHCVFDNIQEKQMFLQILTGEISADYAKIYYNEKLIAEKQVTRLLSEKTAIVSRESKLINEVSLAENMFLIRSGVENDWVSLRKYKEKAVRLFKEFDVEIDIEKPMKRLSDLEKVQIEIIKDYLVGKKVVILTALTNSLSSNEKREVMKLLEKLRDRDVSFIIIEPLEDIEFAVVDRVVIIKHGKTYAVKDAEDCDYMLLHKILYYDEIKKRVDERAILFDVSEYAGAVEIRDLSSDYLKNINISIVNGEIVKLFCMDEKSYEEIIGALRGKVSITKGRIIFENKTVELNKTVIGLKDGIGIIEGNPAIATLFGELSVMDNLQMLLSRKMAGIWVIPKYKKSIKILLEGIIDKELYRKKVRDLNPADVQKVLYSKWLLYSPELLVCIQPFAEGDIQAREVAREMLYKLRKRKIPILLITSNTAELNYCSGREVYVRHGKIIEKEEAYRELYSEM